MSKKKEIEEMEDETVEEQDAASNSKSYKDQVIDFVKGLIAKYKATAIEKNDDPYFLANIDNEKKSEDECVNYVMNDLTSKRIMFGDDSIIYGLIHDYYVDSVQAGDNWSQYLSRGNSAAAPKKVELTEEDKKKLQEKAEAEFLEEQKRKLEEAEKKRIEKEKEKERIRKEKESEAKKLAAEKRLKKKLTSQSRCLYLIFRGVIYELIKSL